jgi:proline iminopeptidase
MRPPPSRNRGASSATDLRQAVEALYAELEPYDSGLLDVGDGNAVFWESYGNPQGKPAVALHGGPGSGRWKTMPRLFDPDAYRVVLYDQRNCGGSTPHASEPDIDLRSNTTANLVADLELLRERLEVEQWLVVGGSWGSTLALAYAGEHRRRVSELILFGVTTGRHTEFDWVFRGGLARFFPAQWDRLLAGLPDSSADVLEAYHELLTDPDPAVCRQAAEDWCLWESATPQWPPTTTELAERFRDPDYALAFARIVTHYARSNAWLEDGALLEAASELAEIPGILVNGSFDFQAPLANAWELRRVWPRAELVVVDDAGHSPTAAVLGELRRAADAFA